MRLIDTITCRPVATGSDLAVGVGLRNHDVIARRHMGGSGCQGGSITGGQIGWIGRQTDRDLRLCFRRYLNRHCNFANIPIHGRLGRRGVLRLLGKEMDMIRSRVRHGWGRQGKLWGRTISRPRRTGCSLAV